ncbi:MAG: hypothetical protein GAK28_03834 [Luteibacter sp.]|nr:MAG: hypothetical protein GAK28_03834 [Luteibacter sp.]
MTLSTELRYLTLAVAATAMMWIPYVIARAMSNGSAAALGTPDPARMIETAWAKRSRMAHLNAVENLVLFAPLVLIAAVAGISTPGTAFAAKLYLGARLVHYVVYTLGIPGIRTFAFLAGWVATVMFVVAILF